MAKEGEGELGPQVLIDPGHTLASVSDRVADITLRFPRPRLWLGLFGFFLAGTGVMLVAIIGTFYAGVGLWGINIPVAWAYAITNFVWWIGIGHAGTLISAILLLLRQRWRNSINRFAEAMTLFAVVQAGIFPFMHLGRPQRFWYILPYPDTMGVWPQWRSPLTWDVVAVGTYFTVSLLFWYAGLLPDLATIRARAQRPWVRKLAAIGSLGWRNSSRHWERYQMAYLLLGGLATPLVVSVHSIVSLDFATAILPGWHSTIFPPYFVAGAIYSGFAMVLMIAIPLRAVLKLDDIVKVKHLEASAKVMLASGVIVAYGYVFETFSDWFSADWAEVGGLKQRLFGPWAWNFWLVMFLNVVVGQMLWIPKVRRSPLLLFLVSMGVQLGMWLERLMIIVTALYRDFMPSSWGFYVPTAWDWMLLLGTVGFFTTLMLLFIRFVPISSIAELRELVHQQGKQGISPAEPPPPSKTLLRGLPPAPGDGDRLYGLAATFENSDQLIAAARAARAAGYHRMEAYTPIHLEELGPAMGHPHTTGVPSLFLLGAVLGGGGVYFMLWYSAAIDYAYNVGGRPLQSWPSFLPLTFEAAVLGGSLFGFFGMLARNKLPRFHHPIFNTPGFERASVDRYVLCIERTDPVFDFDYTRRLLEEQRPLEISAVPE